MKRKSKREGFPCSRSERGRGVLTVVREPGSSVGAWSAAGASPTAVREPGRPVAARSAGGASQTAAREPWSSVALGARPEHPRQW